MAPTEAELTETLLRGYAALNSGDFDAAVALLHPDIEVHLPGGQPPLKGAKAFRAWMEPDAFESQQIEPMDLTFSGNKVLVLQKTRARGSGSGIEMEILIWAVWTFDAEGHWTRLESYLPHEEAEARRAARLPEST